MARQRVAQDINTRHSNFYLSFQSDVFMKLLIRNLARSTTEEELRALFVPHGAVQSCNLVMDKDTGASKGFGFVEMPKQGDAKAAMKTLNGTDVDGSKIRVKKAETKSADEATPPANPND